MDDVRRNVCLKERCVVKFLPSVISYPRKVWGAVDCEHIIPHGINYYRHSTIIKFSFFLNLISLYEHYVVIIIYFIDLGYLYIYNTDSNGNKEMRRHGSIHDVIIHYELCCFLKNKN